MSMICGSDRGFVRELGAGWTARRGFASRARIKGAGLLLICRHIGTISASLSALAIMHQLMKTSSESDLIRSSTPREENRLDSRWPRAMTE
jgi:hypothetical protein